MSTAPADESTASDYLTTSLPYELVRYILELTLPAGPPPPTQARLALHSGPERARGKQLRQFAGVCKRFRDVAFEVGEVVVHLSGGAPLRLPERTQPVRRLCIVFKDLRSLLQPLPLWLLRDLRSFVLSVDIPSSPAILPPITQFIPCLPLLEELTVLSEGASCIPSQLVAGLAFVVPAIPTLRLGHVEGGTIIRFPKQLTCLQYAVSSSQDLFLLTSLTSGSAATLRHFHITPPPPSCPHSHTLSPFYPMLGPVTSCVRSTISSFTYHLSEPDIGRPNRHLLDHFLPHAHLLERLDASRDVLTDKNLDFLPLLPRLQHIRLVRSAESPPSDNSPEHWSWAALAEQAVRVLQNKERRPELCLVVEIKCEGTLRKYDVAQRSCRSALERALSGADEEVKGSLRVTLEYWEDRPAWQAWPVPQG
ncbi:hypothetical protein JCM6882_003809 [Rhodosporidiobolus microsporus]